MSDHIHEDYEDTTMAEIIDSIPPDVLKARIEAARRDRPDVKRKIKQFSKAKEAKIVQQKRDEKKVRSGKFNQIKGLDRLK